MKKVLEGANLGSVGYTASISLREYAAVHLLAGAFGEYVIRHCNAADRANRVSEVLDYTDELLRQLGISDE